ncbi:MAG TPA: DUF2059 domain-containing protein [Steroidobacteraceae bacterium]|nr:DUF2059 domain-containing protein [Steroidobacteraceae bacterium]
MRVCLLAATLVVLGLQPALAEEARPSEESIRHLFEAMNTRHMLDDLMGQMDKTMRDSARQGLGAQTLNPQQQKIFDDMMTKLMALMKEQLNWSAMEPTMISVYRDTFTPQEVAAMTSFYASPAGKAIASKLPQVTQRTMQLMQERMRDLIPRVGQLERDAAQQLKQAADSSPPPPAAH